MHSDFSDKTFLIRCGECGFRYRVQQTAAAQTVCPCCGKEKPLEVIKSTVTDGAVSGKTRPLVSKAKSTIKDVPVKEQRCNERRWGVLFVSVCLQWAIILISPFYIYYQLQKQEPSKQEGNSISVVKNSGSETNPVPGVPAVQAQANAPKPLQKPSVPDIKPDKVPGVIPEKTVAQSMVQPKVVEQPPVQSKPQPKAVVQTEQNIAETLQFNSAFSVPLAPSDLMPATGNKFPAENPSAKKPDVQTGDKKIDSQKSVTQYKAKLNEAEKTLDEASSLILISPDNALEKAIEAIQAFRQLGQNVPSSAYWLISQAFASQSWGRAFAEQTLPVTSMDISFDGRWVLSQHEGPGVVMQDIMNPKAENAVDTGGVSFVKLLFTPDNRFIIGSTKDGTVNIFDATKKEPAQTVKVLETVFRQLTDLQISSDGKWLACCGIETAGDKTDSEMQNAHSVYLWNIEQLPKGIIPPVIHLRGHEKPIRVMAFSTDSGSIVTGSDDAAARVYDLKAAFPGACQAVLKGHKDGITAAAVAPNGKWMATGSRDQTIRLWSLAEGTYEPVSVVLSGHIGWISALAIDRNSDRLISSSYDRTVRLWSFSQGNIQKVKDCIEIPNDQGTVHKIFLSKDGRLLVTLGSDASLRLRELSRSIGEELPPRNTLTLRNKMLPIQHAMLTPDERYLVFSYLNLNNKQNSGIRIWSLQLDDLLKYVKD
ncbi:MAG: hypothetical protein FWE67_04615 [Planctomycetaceae bacterium]|nr:hypothetical protein [Planctomycetaceae bacterium]